MIKAEIKTALTEARDSSDKDRWRPISEAETLEEMRNIYDKSDCTMCDFNIFIHVKRKYYKKHSSVYTAF